jgi:histidinol-phosphate aminotransferase
VSQRSPRFRSVLDEYVAYRPGKVARSPEGRSFKLSSNESPYGPLPSVREVIADAGGLVNRYPDNGCTALIEAIAARHDVPESHVAVGCGSVGVAQMLLESVGEPGVEVVYAWRSFEAYPTLADLAGVTSVRVPLTDETHDLRAMGDAISDRTRLVFVCNPNNPTGTVVRRRELEEFFDRVPEDCLIVLDEAYHEYIRDPEVPDGLDLYPDRPNLVILRTFSKVYGLCGLRVGYALGSEQFKQACDVVRQPFSVNMLAQAAATEALKHGDDIATRVERTVIERVHVESELNDRGLATSDGEANFTWVDLGDHDETAVMKGLGERGVIVRAGQDLGGPGHLRVTFGTRPENDRFLQALDETLREL